MAKCSSCGKPVKAPCSLENVVAKNPKFCPNYIKFKLVRFFKKQ